MFDAFIGIDWSGANGSTQKGICVAEAINGRSAPRLINGPMRNGAWSRSAVKDLIERECRRRRVLIGLDFAFGFPNGVVSLDWNYVEQICALDPNFYGGRFFLPGEGLHLSYVNGARHKGDLYSARAYRQTELAAAATKGATPQTVFNAVGAAQVGPSSISGMRMLLALSKSRVADGVAIWPFDEFDLKKSLIVEVFPRFFPLSVGVPSAMRNYANLQKALAAFDSETNCELPRSEDEGDALVTAVALRKLATGPEAFGNVSDETRNEGWIFGVPVRRPET